MASVGLDINNNSLFVCSLLDLNSSLTPISIPVLNGRYEFCSIDRYKYLWIHKNANEHQIEDKITYISYKEHGCLLDVNNKNIKLKPFILRMKEELLKRWFCNEFSTDDVHDLTPDSFVSEHSFSFPDSTLVSSDTPLLAPTLTYENPDDDWFDEKLSILSDDSFLGCYENWIIRFFLTEEISSLSEIEFKNEFFLAGKVLIEISLNQKMIGFVVISSIPYDCFDLSTDLFLSLQSNYEAIALGLYPAIEHPSLSIKPTISFSPNSKPILAYISNFKPIKDNSKPIKTYFLFNQNTTSSLIINKNESYLDKEDELFRTNVINYKAMYDYNKSLNASLTPLLIAARPLSNGYTLTIKNSLYRNIIDLLSNHHEFNFYKNIHITKLTTPKNFLSAFIKPVPKDIKIEKLINDFNLMKDSIIYLQLFLDQKDNSNRKLSEKNLHECITYLINRKYQIKFKRTTKTEIIFILSNKEDALAEEDENGFIKIFDF